MAFPVKIDQSEKDGFQAFWDRITGKTSEELAKKNFALQQQAFEYQKQLNQMQMEREDTAYQRAVKDANAAGLSSLSVGNGANSTTGTAGEAPQINDYAADSFNKGMNLLNTITQFQNNITQQLISKRKAEADIAKTNAETADIEAHTDLFNYTLSGQKNLFDRDYADKINKYDFYNKYGLFSDSDPYEKYAILNSLNGKQYSDIIQTNQFNKIGLLYGLISKIGNKLTDGKISSVDDLVDSAGNLFNKLDVKIPNILNNSLEIDPNWIEFLSDKNINPDFKTKDKISSIVPNVAPKLLTHKEKKEIKKYNKKHKF